MPYSIRVGTNGAAVSQRIRADTAKHPAVLSAALSQLAFQGRLDAQESMRKELDRPKPFTQNAVNYKKSNRTTLTSSVFINKNNEYLQYVVYGGVRRNAGRILVPEKKLRSDKYGNLSKTRRKRILASPNTFKRRKGAREYLVRRVGKRLEFVGSLEKSTRYKKQGYWKFHDAMLKTYERRFGAIFNKQLIKQLGRR